MIYYFTYRHGELEAEVHADCELGAWALLASGDAVISINADLLNPEAWDLQDVEEEDYDHR